MNIKLDTLETKKQQYKKHRGRLAKIYHGQTGINKIIKQSQSIDKLMAITHRIHQASNLFHINLVQKIQKQSKAKDWNKVDSSFLGTVRKKNVLPANTERRKHHQQELQKENIFLFHRLMNVKPTVQTSKLMEEFKATSRKSSLAKLNQTQRDFSSILQQSILTFKQKKRIGLKLHNHNHQITKINFLKGFKEILDEKKLYIFGTMNSKGKSIETPPSFGRDLINCQFCIFNQKNEKVEIIVLKELVNDIKTISKGYLKLFQTNETISYNNEQVIEFVFPNMKSTFIQVKIQKKNLKMKLKASIAQSKSLNLLQIASKF